MKDIEQLEELLNSYIDGELDERKSNEVKRLIDNDKNARLAFESLHRCRKLLGSLRPSAAPEGFCESVTRDLERNILLADTEVYQHSKKGKRRLIYRHFITAAAMIALVAALSYVVLDIFVPKSARQKFADNVLNRKPKPQVLFEQPFAQAPEQDIVVAAPKGPSVPLVAKLTLITDSPVEADWLIGKALMNTALFDKTSAVDRKTGSVKYVLSCDRNSIVSLIGELNFIWPKCSDATLQIGTEQQGKFITINNVSARQTLDICKADNYNHRLRMASDIAMINQIAVTDVLQNYLAKQNADSDFIVPNKPVLTSSEKIEKPLSDNVSEPANFTITIIGKN
ncbi:MAG: hypothetical protein A2Y10_20220 [Planctomycetes bacterium GWF2_41_51]|nr:MAG: hypothetical protein A2Y10_20220 [Planctomycetes bacterium GWF2_41_51]HBG26997.1 hypothetical protein [Phycisphaerales bacterium]